MYNVLGVEAIWVFTDFLIDFACGSKAGRSIGNHDQVIKGMLNNHSFLSETGMNIAKFSIPQEYWVPDFYAFFMLGDLKYLDSKIVPI